MKKNERITHLTHPKKVQIEADAYYYDLPAPRGASMKDGFVSFFRRTILVREEKLLK
jgi:hypothetical protein